MKEIRTVAGIGSMVLLRLQCPMSRTCGPLIKSLKAEAGAMYFVETHKIQSQCTCRHGMHALISLFGSVPRS